MKNDSFVEKSLDFLVLFTIFMVPLVIFPGRLYPFISSKSFFFMGLAEVSFFTWFYLAFTNSAYRLTKKQILIFLVPVFLLVSLTISAIWAPIPNLAFWGSFERATGLIFLIHCVVFGLVTTSVVNVSGKEFINKIYNSIFYSGIILAISTFINENFINIPSLFLFDGPNSGDLLGNSSFSGGYLIFAFFVGLIILIKNFKTSKKFWTGLGLVLVLLSPIMDKARGALLGILIGLMISCAVWMVTSARKSLRGLGIMIITLLLVAGIFTSVSLVKDGTKLNEAFIKATTNSRLIFWKSAVMGIKERPVFGWGQENYIVAFGKNFDSAIMEPGSTNEIWSDKPHNSVLEAFVSGGVVGGLGYLLFFISLIVLPIYLYRKNKMSRVAAVLFVGMFIAYFVQDMLIFDTVPSLVMLFALFGLLVGQMLETNRSKNFDSDTQKSILALICIVLLVFSWINFVHKPLKKSKGFISSMNSAVDRQVKIRKMVELTPMGNGTDVGYMASVISKAYAGSLGEIKKDPNQVESAHKEIKEFLDTVDTLDFVAENNARLWLTAAELVNIDMALMDSYTKEDFERGLTYLDRAKELIPENPRLYWTYGQLYLNVDDYKKAHEAYKKAYEINPEVVKSKDYLEKFEELFGNNL